MYQSIFFSMAGRSNEDGLKKNDKVKEGMRHFYFYTFTVITSYSCSPATRKLHRQNDACFLHDGLFGKKLAGSLSLPTLEIEQE
jgi:hypothetical protein